MKTKRFIFTYCFLIMGLYNGFTQSVNKITLKDTDCYYYDESLNGYYFKDSLKDGKWILYNTKMSTPFFWNKKLLIGQFKDFKKNGKFIEIEDGYLTERNYKDGILHGAYIIKNNDNCIVYQVNYINGEKHGPAIIFKNCDTLISVTTYEHDSITCWVNYDYNTEVIIFAHGDENYNIDGEYKMYSFEGELLTLAFFSSGVVKEFTNFWPNGNKKMYVVGTFVKIGYNPYLDVTYPFFPSSTLLKSGDIYYYNEEGQLIEHIVK